jgi:hypothetical protein
MGFEPNTGQADLHVKFLSRGLGYTLFLTEDEAVLAVQKPEVRSQNRKNVHGPWVLVSCKKQRRGLGTSHLSGHTCHCRFQPPAPSFLRLKLLRANPTAMATGLDESTGKSNYFIGNDPRKWRTNVPTFGGVRYENIYPGVDLVYYNNKGGQLEYDFAVAPGPDPGAITLAIDAEGRVGPWQKAVGRAVRRQRKRRTA